jgi:hypothetical protein
MTLIEHLSDTTEVGEPQGDEAGADVDVLFDQLVLSLRLLDDRGLIRRALRFEQRLAAERLTAAARAAHPDTGAIPDELIDDVSGMSPDQTDYAVDRHLEDAARPRPGE